MTAAPARFAAGMATATLALFIAAQVSSALLIVVVAMMFTIATHGINDSRALGAAMASLGPALVLGSSAVAGVVAALCARFWAWDLVRDRGAGGIGMVAPTRRQLLATTLGGVALAAAYLAFARFVMPERPGAPLGPLSQIAASGTAGRIAIGIVAVLIAPPVEEFLFRGLLLKGFTESWGLPGAALFVSAVFVVLHLPEVVHYWPAIIAIAILTGVTLFARLMTGSVIAAMALHAAYNTTMVAAVLVV